MCVPVLGVGVCLCRCCTPHPQSGAWHVAGAQKLLPRELAVSARSCPRQDEWGLCGVGKTTFQERRGSGSRQGRGQGQHRRCGGGTRRSVWAGRGAASTHRPRRRLWLCSVTVLGLPQATETLARAADSRAHFPVLSWNQASELMGAGGRPSSVRLAPRVRCLESIPAPLACQLASSSRTSVLLTEMCSQVALEPHFSGTHLHRGCGNGVLPQVLIWPKS